MGRSGALKLVDVSHLGTLVREGRFSGAEADLLQSMVDGYKARRLGAQRHMQRSFERDLGVIEDFIKFTAKTPWDWTANDFECWCYEELFLSRGLKSSSQRTYQAAVRGFLDYLVGNPVFQDRTRDLVGKIVHQICTPENCIPHLVGQEQSRKTKPMTPEHIEQFFDGLDRAAAEAARFKSKGYLPLLRDKALFYTQYCFALRISEAQGLDTGALHANPMLPELEDCASISVRGKGSRGSGPKHREVPATLLDFAPILSFYRDKVRRIFIKRAKDPNIDTLFLSERGSKMSISTIEARFQNALALSGLAHEGYTNHSLRGSAITHWGMTLSIDTIRRIVGHVYATTTLGYMQIPDEYAKAEIVGFVMALLDLEEDRRNGRSL